MRICGMYLFFVAGILGAQLFCFHSLLGHVPSAQFQEGAAGRSRIAALVNLILDFMSLPPVGRISSLGVPYRPKSALLPQRSAAALLCCGHNVA